MRFQPLWGSQAWLRSRGSGRPLERLRLPAVACSVLGLALLLPACEQLPPLPNVPPTALFIHSPVAPIVAGNTVVTFNATGSRDSDGQIVSYSWDFGDGTGELTGGEARVSHVFPDTPATCLEVTYTVLLTVRDDAGDSGTASAPVTAIELPLPGAPECQPGQAD